MTYNTVGYKEFPSTTQANSKLTIFNFYVLCCIT